MNNHPRLKFYFLITCVTIMVQSFAQTDADYAKLMKEQQAIEAQKQATIPKENAARHIQTIVTSKAIINALATTIKPIAFNKIDPALKQELTSLIASTKTNLADLGMSIFLEGPHGQNPALFFVCTAIIKNPKDTLAINDLGVLLKNDGIYEKAFQCFRYADELNNHSSVFKTNMGWTAAYYGDFTSAANYFNDAILINPKNAGPLEGLCAMAFSKGDYQMLMQNLLKRMKLNPSGPAGGAPSQPMLDYLEEAYHNDASLRKQNPFDDHNFDADPSAADENSESPSAANGNSESPTYPSFSGYFFIDPITIDNELGKIKQAYKTIKSDVETRENNLIGMHAALPPLSKPAYTNDYGELVVPHSYEREFKMFDRITVQFLKRDNWLHFQDLKASAKVDPYTDQAIVWSRKAGSIADADERQKFICQSADQNLAAAKQKLLGDYEFFNNAYRKVIDNINWYIAATTLSVKKVHDVKLNDYLNYKRETVIRGAVVLQFAGWVNACVGISNAINEAMIVKQDCLGKNTTELGIMGNGEVKIKKLKTWPEPCNVPTGDYGSSKYGATLSMTCDELKVSLGKVIKLNYETKFGANETQDVTKISISGGVDKSSSADLSIGEHKVGEAGLSGELNGDVFIVVQNGHVTDFGVKGTAKIKGEAGVKSGNEKVDKYLPSGNVEMGGSASWTVQTGFKGALDPASASASNVPTGK